MKRFLCVCIMAVGMIFAHSAMGQTNPATYSFSCDSTLNLVPTAFSFQTAVSDNWLGGGSNSEKVTWGLSMTVPADASYLDMFEKSVAAHNFNTCVLTAKFVSATGPHTTKWTMKLVRISQVNFEASSSNLLEVSNSPMVGVQVVFGGVKVQMQ